MNRLVETLRPFYMPSKAAGDDPLDRAALHGALEHLAAQLRMMLWMRAAMIGVIFIIEIIFGVLYHDMPTVLGAIAAAAGLTIAGAIKAMEGVSREMAETGLLVSLAAELDAKTLSQIVHALIAELARGASGKIAASVAGAADSPT
ncbi:MAG: hypothetical protein HY060_09255 [Proteobacteria bacterium]|nr:hypothetical protein [Pseudomonadota bacterium]